MFVYWKYPKERKDGYAIEKFYKKFYADEYFGKEDQREVERKALKLYTYHVSLIEDLILELTRAANFICDEIRKCIFKGFRIEEGALLVTRGDLFGSRTFRVEYTKQELIEIPYKGLRNFMEIRKSRDIHIGEGVEEDYFRKMPWEE